MNILDATVFAIYSLSLVRYICSKCDITPLCSVAICYKFLFLVPQAHIASVRIYRTDRYIANSVRNLYR